jgi:hypothetical protein
MSKKPPKQQPPKQKADKAPKLPPDQRLIQALEKDKETAPIGPMVTSAKIFLPFYTICKHYLESQGRTESIRHFVAEMALAFRAEARSRFGHDTIETLLLSKLLKEDREGARVGRPDALTYIQSNKRVHLRLDAEQQTAAEQIIQVWKAFGKGLMIGGRDLNRVGGSGRVLHPLDVMDQDLWEHYKETYQPWQEVTKKIPVSRREAGSSLTLASITFSILVDDVYPENVDKGYMLTKGTALRGLKKALTHYWEPWKLLKQPDQPSGQGPEARLPSTGDNPLAAP